MVHIQGTWDIPTIAATIGQALIDTDDFTDADPDVTMGTVVNHTSTNTYVWITPGVALTSPVDNNTAYSKAGMRVIFSNNWNTDTHEPSGTIYRGFVNLYGTAAYQGGYNTLANITSPNSFPISLFVDKFGFVGVIQNNYSAGNPSLFACEFFPSAWMEYDDAQKPICFFTKHIYDSFTNGIDSTGQHVTNVNSGYHYIRPFNVAYGVTAAGNMGAYMPREAYRSEGNNKTMFDFPWYQNDYNSLVYPIAQTRRWFPVSATGGHAIGDIVNWIDPDGVTVHKYIVVAATATKLYAIAYQNAFDYATDAKR
ncbi:hypothetical protein [Methanorbis furvi]|uniref:Uncharacterized protein n=1 Tax=Methanorbis furvi TaxID=3028299 RepID=A0AAE4SCK4_9EURY|nr:hypothetical protein [Methanocorpusculaceae archaeon Ag1]